MVIDTLTRRLLPALLLLALTASVAAQPGTWVRTPQEPPSNPLLYATHFFDGLHGLVAGDNGGIGVMYRTRDGGTIWTPVVLPGSPRALNDLYFVPGTPYGFVVGNENYVAVTTDSGQTWANRSVPTGMWAGALSDLHAVYFQNSSRGWVVGRLSGSNGPRMAITHDRGQNWTEVPMTGPSNNLYGIDFFDVAHGIVVGTGNPPRKSVSTNGGLAWEANATMGTATPAQSTSMYGVDAVEGTSIAYAAGGFVITAPRYPVIRRTTDFGVTWSNVITASVPGLMNPARDVLMTGDSVIYVAGEDGGMVRSTDAGSSWTAESVPPIGSDDLWKFSLTNDNFAFAVGTGGTVLRTRLTPNATFTAGATIDFGTLCPEASAQRSFLIGNDGLGMLNITGTSLTQPVGGWATFEVAQPTPAQVWARQTEQIRINVQVAAGAPAGTHTGQIRIGTNDENGRGSDTFRIITLSVTVPANGMGIDSAVSRDAGSVRVGALRALSLTNLLRNTSPNCRTVIDTVVLARGLDYRIASAPIDSDTVLPGDRRSLLLEFAPSATCLRHDTIIVIPAGGGPRVRIPIVGTGVEPSYAASPPDTLRFGGIQVGASGAQTLKLSNRKAGSCLDRTELRSLTIGGPNAAEFSTTTVFQPGVSFINPNQDVNVTFVAVPVAAGPRIAYAIIEHEVSAVPDTVVLLVRGVAADLSSSTDEIVFPTTEVGFRFDTTLVDGLRNFGASPVTILSASIAGPDATVFELVGPALNQTIPAGAIDSILIGFTPTSVATFTATLTITASDGSTLSIRLRGDGDIPAGAVGRNPVVFGSTEVGACDTLTVIEYLVNTGRVPLRVRALSIAPHPRDAGAPTDRFRVLSPVVPPEIVIAPGDSLPITLEFCPLRLGEHVVLLQASTNIPGITLGDTLVADAIRGSIIAVDDVTFASTRVGTRRDSTLDPFLVNQDIDPLDITSLTLVGGDAADFTITSPSTPASVAPRSALPIDIAFTPSSRGLKSTTLRIVSSRGTQDIPIAGAGIFPIIDVVSTSRPRVRVGNQQDVIVRLSNSGSDSGGVSSAALGANPAFTLVGVPVPFVLRAGESRDVLVRFAPDSLCEQTAPLQINAEGIGGRYAYADTTLLVAGIGVAPHARAIAPEIVFTGVPVDSPEDSVLSAFVVNVDPGDPSSSCVDSTFVDAMTIVGADASSFAVLVPVDGRSALPAGAALPMTLQFLPRRAGVHNAVLEIRYDGIPDSVVRITLVGNALAPAEVFAGLSFGPDQSARPGTTIRVPMSLTGELASIAAEQLTVALAYDRSLLRLERVVPRAGATASASPPAFDARHAHSVVVVSANENLAGTIAELEFTVLLGRVLVGDVFADSVFVVNRPNVRIAADSASISIAEFCDAQGRLLTFGGELLVRAAPNPASSDVVIQYTLPALGAARLAVYDASGMERATLVDGVIEPGTYYATIDARTLGTGTYYCRLDAGRFTSTTIIRVEK